MIGAGRTGAAVARELLRRSASVTLLESGGAGARAAAQQLADAGVTVALDAAAVAPGDFDLIVPSPGVVEHHPLLVAAGAAGVPVYSEPELAWRLADGRTEVLAVTGTNGKTTTTELLATCVAAPTGGNIGTPLVTLLGADDPPPLVVAELSSFQLRFAESLRPKVGLLLNIAPDHLDWHGSLAAYRGAKARLWQTQRNDDITVFNADDEGARLAIDEHPPPGRTATFTAAPPAAGQVGVEDGAIVSRLDDGPTVVARLDEMQLVGPHNVANACAATAAALCAGAPAQGLAEPLRQFRPGQHRLEVVAIVGGVTYVNDSKATNPHAAAAALGSFEPGRIVWIAGGLGKGLTFTSLAPLIRRAAKAVVTIGASGPDIAAVARGVGVPVTEAGTLDVAVARAAAIADSGDVVLLAPACASMDQFRDYAERGAAFRAGVESLSSTLGAQGASSGR